MNFNYATLISRRRTLSAAVAVMASSIMVFSGALGATLQCEYTVSKKQATAKLQHYVPRFLLKQFAFGKKHHLHVFDKRSDRAFIANVQKLAAENRFYDFVFHGSTFTLEEGLGRLESAAKPLIDRILQTDSAGSVTGADRATLAAFFAVQFTRTRAFREQWRSIGDVIADQLRAWTMDKDRTLLEAHLSEQDESHDRLALAQMIATAPKAFGAHFLNKMWVLLTTDRETPFVIGDNPLTLQNLVDRGPLRGNLGLGVVGKRTRSTRSR